MNQLMNTNPVTASASNARDNPCFGNDPSVATLNVCADDEHSYELPYAQFLYAELCPNPALERNADASPEKLLIAFGVAEIVVFGCGLKSLERAIQRYELKFVKAADRRFAPTLRTHVAAVAITFTKPTP